VTLHEIQPRSIYREWYTDVLNSVPICNSCHDWAHANGQEARDELTEHATKRIEAMKK
jgi:hypothetical protein